MSHRETRYRDYPKPRRSAKKRLLANVVEADRGYLSPCWLWQGRKDKDGYGRIRAGEFVNGRRREIPAHWLLKGSPPEGTEADHLCRQRSCVNPDHIEFVTHAENIRRRDSDKDSNL